ncbi:MAG: carboxypeptidase-like regulatory domain-containing protein, partial [Bacteroidales bacterium]|nr:carboxypeptidase-like regulatory domain-containing protein [Bacteroidales bacterium]
MKKLVISLFLLSQVLIISGQKSNLTIQLDSILFRDVVDTLEKVVPVKIYYADKWTDSLYLSLNAGDEFFEDAFGRSLRREGFSFIITEGNKLILSRGYQIKTGFMNEYRDFLKRSQTAVEARQYTKLPQAEEETSIGDESRIFRIGKPSAARDGERVTLTGNIFNTMEGQPLQGAVVYIEKLKAGAMTNEAGFYSIALPAGQYQIEYRMVGMRTARRNVIIYSDGTLDVGLTESTNQLGEIVVSANRGNIVRNVSMGVEKIDVKMLRQIPMGMGEADIVKSSLMLPGIQTV